jgi:hypothetical protein
MFPTGVAGRTTAAENKIGTIDHPWKTVENSYCHSNAHRIPPETAPQTKVSWPKYGMERRLTFSYERGLKHKHRR